MDQELLVDAPIEDGRSLLAQLALDGLDISVAFWVKTADEGLWHLYLGSKSLASMPLADAFRALYAALQKSGASAIAFSDLKLIEVGDPVAAQVIAIRDRQHVRQPSRYRGPSLAKLPVEEAYIYPSSTGPMTADEVVDRIADLMKPRMGRVPSLVTLRDGSRFRAIPLGMRRNAGLMEIYLDDVDSRTERSVAADQVANIL